MSKDFSVDPDLNFTRQLRNHSEGKQAVDTHAQNKWDAQHGHEYSRAKKEEEQAQSDLDECDRQLRRAQKVLEGTDRYASKSKITEQENSSEGDVSFSEWSVFDRITLLVALCSSGVLLALGATNVATVILASGIPVFLDQPILAWLLAGLVPAAAIALKSGSNLLQLDKSRRNFSVAIFALACITAVIWVVLFSVSFEGATPDINLDALFEESDSGHDLTALRNTVQILAEVLIGAALFLVVDKIIASYRVGYRQANEAYPEAEKDVHLWEARVAAAREVFNEAHGKVSRLSAARSAYVSEALADWLSQQSGKRS